MSQGWSKIFNRINWLNRPSTNTPLNATNLNAGDSAIDKLDDRIITLDTVKADMQVVNGMVSDISVNDADGVITVKYKNGSTKTYDTNLEKIATNFEYSYELQRLVLTLSDGSKQYVDMSALITQYEFKDSTTIAFSVDSTGKVSASVKNGSITEAMLETGYLANIKVEVAKAEAAASQAQSSETSSDYNAKLSRSYAIGGSGVREGEDTDNAMYYYEQAKQTDIGQIRSEVAELNSNLDTLEFGEISGSKNIINIPNPLTISGAWYKSYNFKCKRNTSYVLSLNTDSYTLNHGCAIYDLNGTVIGNFSYSNITFNSGDNEELCLYLYSGNETSGTSIYSNIQIEEGTVATPYEPYIPSVKMLAEEVSAQNESLGDYGLNNKCPELGQGYCNFSGTGNEFQWISQPSTFVGTKNPIDCVSGDTVRVLFDVVQNNIVIQWNDGTHARVDNANELSAVVPSGVTKCCVYCATQYLTPTTIGNVRIYVNNAIDELKNDLGGNDKVVIQLLNSCTGDLYYHKIGDLIVVNGVVNIPKANENVKVAVLPNSKVNQANAFTIYNFTDDTHDSEYATRYASDSSLVVKVPIANKDYIISGCYIGN